MRMAGLLEVCADSVCSAVNAARGGADRIELCSALPLGGLSPDEDLFCMVRERVDLPVRVLLRPRAGDFLYDEDEFELLCCQAQCALHARLWMRSAPHERKTECRYKKY